jgi:hypothetical protein
MLGLVMTLVSAAVPVVPAAGMTCVEGPASCDLAPLVLAEPRQREELATPTVIDCQSPVVPIALSTLVGECIDTIYDASYRVSRDPDSERSQSLSPGRDRRRVGVACDGLPQRLPGLPLSDAQPVALFATPGERLVAVTKREPAPAPSLPARFLDPPDRPPRV